MATTRMSVTTSGCSCVICYYFNANIIKEERKEKENHYANNVGDAKN
jgi:hypothetical protein